MEKYILDALKMAAEKMESRVPKTRKVEKSVCVSGWEVSQLIKFMSDNGIPDDAFLHGDEEGNSVSLVWDSVADMTEIEKNKWRHEHFGGIAFPLVAEAMYGANRKRIPVWSSALKDRGGSLVYQLFLQESWDRLEQYYDLYFEK